MVTRVPLAKDIYPITLVAMFIATFVLGGPALSFGIRAILLEPKSALRGVLRGWAIYRKNFGQSLAANAIFFGLNLGIKAAASIVSFRLADPAGISNLMGSNIYQLYLAVTMSLPGQICGGVVSLVAVPMLSIVMTLIYRNAIDQELHPENIKKELRQVKVQRRRWRIGSLKKKGVWGPPGEPD